MRTPDIIFTGKRISSVQFMTNLSFVWLFVKSKQEKLLVQANVFFVLLYRTRQRGMAIPNTRNLVEAHREHWEPLCEPQGMKMYAEFTKLQKRKQKTIIKIRSYINISNIPAR